MLAAEAFDGEVQTASGFTLFVTWFQPSRGHTRRLPVHDLTELRRLLEPYQHLERLAVYLDWNRGESGWVWVHVTEDRAWVAHFPRLRGPSAYSRDESY